MFEVWMAAVLGCLLLLAALAAVLMARGAHRRAAACGLPFARAHGLTVAHEPSFEFYAKGRVRGRGLIVIFMTVREPNESSSTEQASLRLRGGRRFGRVVIAHPDRVDPSMKQAPLTAGRVVAILPGEPDPAWLVPGVVAAIGALPPSAHVETYDDQIEVVFRNHPGGAPPLEAGLDVAHAIADGR